MCECVADALFLGECARVDGLHAIGAAQVGGLHRGASRQKTGACHSAAGPGFCFNAFARALQLCVNDGAHACAASGVLCAREVEAAIAGGLGAVQQDARA